MKQTIYLFFFILSCLTACKKGSGNTDSKAIPIATAPKANHKLTQAQLDQESALFYSFMEKRSEAKIYVGIMNLEKSVFPSLYHDDRYRITYLVPVDKAFADKTSSQLEKLKDQIPETYELQLFNNNVIVSTDFSWTGASALSGEKITFLDGNKVGWQNQTANILESFTLSDKTRVLFIDKAFN